MITKQTTWKILVTPRSYIIIANGLHSNRTYDSFEKALRAGYRKYGESNYAGMAPFSIGE